MTATRERQRATTPDSGGPGWAERSALTSVRGKAWWSAVLIAVLPTALGVFVDGLISGKPAVLFAACYVVGCALAVTLVRRRSVFGPMIQPPLVLAVTMPVVLLATSSTPSTGGGLSSKLLLIASPLINGFPAMACTTVLTVAIGLIRMFGLERSPASTAGAARPGTDIDDIDGPTARALPPKKPAPRAEAAPPKKRPRDTGRSGQSEPRRSRPEDGERPARRSTASRGGAPRGQDTPARPRRGENVPNQRATPPPGRSGGTPRQPPRRGAAPDRGQPPPPPPRTRRPRGDDGR